MKKIASFTIDHIKLQPGIYVSRKDYLGDQVITTFDIRMTSPNEEPVMNTAELHAMEHLAATFLRNHAEFGPKVIYWGPMGCCTGSYLIVQGDYSPREIAGLMLEMFRWISTYEGDIPGATPRDCGNWSFTDLAGARQAAAHYVKNTLENIDDAHLEYAK